MLDLLTALGYFFLVLVFALVAVIMGTIDGGGFLASVTVGFAVIFGGGLGWFIIVGVFFALGVAFTWYKYGYKKKLGGAQEKGGKRNWPNILANGGVASVAAVGELFHPGNGFTAVFLGSIGAAAADTVATELGLLSKMPPRMIVRPHVTVSPGTSGGVSPLGFMGAILASLVIGVMALFLGTLGSSLQVVSLCVVGGVSGALVDSLLGGALQRKGHCRVCLKEVETLKHCGEKTVKTAGISFVENNIVNLLATFAGGVVALGYLLAFFH